MFIITLQQKSEMMNEQTIKYVKRCGLASGADWDGNKWQQ
jgi:hypothetical protein